MNAPVRVRVQRLSPGEPDYEMLWTLILPGAALCAAGWLFLGLPLPGCPMREWTGVPCFGCGATRCLNDLLHGNLRAAVAWNPAVAAAAGAIALVWLYCAAAWLLRLPRVRIVSLTPAGVTLLRVAVVAVIAVNWMYLFFRFGVFAG